MFKKTIILSIISSSLLFSSSIDSIDNNSIIIYNNLSLINNNGKIKVDNGVSDLTINDISSNIITDSVALDFKESNVKILEQNYRYDLINFNSMLNFYIDKEVNYNGNKVKLLSNENGCVINSNNIIKKISCDTLELNEIPNGMTSLPSLTWKISNDKNYNGNFNLSYLSNGFSWESNYVANIKDNSIILNGWINLKNDSDTNLDNYKLILLSGDVNVIKNNNVRMYEERMVMSKMAMDVDAMNVVEESFSGYHTYKIPFNVDIPKKSNKQISFINQKINKFNIEHKVEINYIQDKYKFDKTITFENSESNGLGIPLPKGKIRFYEKDKENINYFIGENKIDNIANKETLSINIGKDFDSTLELKLLEQVNKSDFQLNKIEYNLKNPSKETKHYIIKQINPIYNSLKKSIDINSNCNKNCKVDFSDTRYLIYNITLNGDSEYKFETTIKKD